VSRDVTAIAWPDPRLDLHQASNTRPVVIGRSDSSRDARTQQMQRWIRQAVDRAAGRLFRPASLATDEHWSVLAKGQRSPERIKTQDATWAEPHPPVTGSSLPPKLGSAAAVVIDDANRTPVRHRSLTSPAAATRAGLTRLGGDAPRIEQRPARDWSM
jgi:hypothetical protein